MADPTIPELWAALRANPLAPGPWKSLAEAFAAEGLDAQRSYATGQWRRLGSDEETLPGNVGTTPVPPWPSAVLAEEWLRHPQAPPAQRWR